MAALNLDAQAKALYANFIHKNGPSARVDERILDACATPEGPRRIGLAELATILTEAMPEQASVIQKAEQRCLAHNPEGQKGTYVTSILSARVFASRDAIYNANAPVLTVRGGRDPYTTELSVDPKADFVLLFNARDVDHSGQPLLMKVVARERADLSKLDLSAYRTKWEHPDIQRIDDDADFVEVTDEDENEFAFGDPVKQSSLNCDGDEISSSVLTKPSNQRTTNFFYPVNVGGKLVPDKTRPAPGGPVMEAGPALDTTPVITFEDRVHVAPSLSDDFPTSGGWLNTKLGPSKSSLALTFERGFMFEPGAEAQIMSATFPPPVLTVPADDADLIGSEPLEIDLKDRTLSEVLALPFSANVKSPSEQAYRSVRLGSGKELLNAYPAATAAQIAVGGAAFSPYGDLTVTDFKAAKMTVDKVPERDADRDAQRVRITLQDGFLASTGGASLANWKVVAGYTDGQGQWHGSDAKIVTDPQGRGEQCLEVRVDDAPELMKRKGNIEIRLFNADNIPAERIQLTLQSVKWAAGAR
jgi:hypothetical protein